jgi:hypothetical protein
MIATDHYISTNKTKRTKQRQYNGLTVSFTIG